MSENWGLNASSYQHGKTYKTKNKNAFNAISRKPYIVCGLISFLYLFVPNFFLYKVNICQGIARQSVYRCFAKY